MYHHCGYDEFFDPNDGNDDDIDEIISRNEQIDTSDEE